MIVKVCGLRDGDNIRRVVGLGVDWIGFVFYPKSPRYVSMIPSHAGIIPDRSQPLDAFSQDAPASGQLQCEKTDRKVKRVGVFVDDMPQNIITRAVNYQLDIVQLHGSETPTMIRNLRATIDPDIRPDIRFMKAISLPAGNADSFDMAAATLPYAECVDYFLFDTQTPLAGGSGHHFNWSLLSSYQGPVPFLLSGGIGLEDAEDVKKFRHPFFRGVDLNSRFETEPGVKDIERLKHFMSLIGAAEY